MNSFFKKQNENDFLINFANANKKLFFFYKKPDFRQIKEKSSAKPSN